MIMGQHCEDSVSMNGGNCEAAAPLVTKQTMKQVWFMLKIDQLGVGGYLCLKTSWEFSFFTMERENKQHIKSMLHECVNCKGDEYRWKT